MRCPANSGRPLGLTKDGFVSLSLVKGKLELRPVSGAVLAEPGSPWAKELYEFFGPVRQSLESHSEAEINEVIDDALRRARTEDTWGEDSAEIV